MQLRSRTPGGGDAKPVSNGEDTPNTARSKLLKGTARTASGEEVPKDVLRRKEAEALDARKGVDRPLQFLCALAVVLPYAWAFATQESPSAYNQVNSWAQRSWMQLTDGVINPDFQAADACYFSYLSHILEHVESLHALSQPWPTTP
eukprot:6185993-Pleurochrysis_carterae.AAC.6